MMMNSKRNRGGGGRMHSGNRTDKRQVYSQDRPRRTQVPDKNVNIDGVYKNQRLTHVVFSLVGSSVQVQVRNGNVYEGVLKTFSQKGDIVLEVVHLVEDTCKSSTPNRDQIIPKLIVKAADLVMVNAANVDLDFAVKDSFTDTGISKYNGEMSEKEMRDLQPWESEGGEEISLDGDGDKSSNGWDANDMFQTNANMFNIKSSYDDSLEQYTTKLERRNSAEYRRREEEALKMAAEIERNPTYQKHIMQENGEGGDDEETAFSSVLRPDEVAAHQQHMRQAAANLASTGGGPQKYIPPNKRQGSGGGVQKPSRGGYNPGSASGGPSLSRSNSNTQQHTTVSSQVSTDSQNGDEVGRSSVPASTAGPTVRTSPAGHDQAPVTQPDHGAPQGNKLEDRKKKGRDEKVIAELKRFSSDFKLDDKESNKDREINKDNKDASAVINNNTIIKDKPSVQENTSASISGKESEVVNKNERDAASVPSAVDENAMASDAVSSSPLSSLSSEQSSVAQDNKSLGVGNSSVGMSGKSEGQSPLTSADGEVKSGATSTSQETKSSGMSIKSTLNPNAKVFNPKSVPSPGQQIPTPPRPTTQSPIVQPMMNLQPQPVYPTHGQPFIMPPVVINQGPSPQQQVPAYNNVRPKRATVSVKPDPVQAQVQAAAGQPLIQSAQPTSYIMYPQHMNVMGPPQPTGYQVGQVMPMPAAAQMPRGFIPSTSVQGMVPTSMQSGNMGEPSSSHQTAQVFMSQSGPMPAHMSHSGQFSSHPNHNIHMIAAAGQSGGQPGAGQAGGPQMNPASMGHQGHQGHHPAPSPVHTSQQSMPGNPGGQHPPSSGTPQPHQPYQGQPGLQGHPPLQPSPVNPTSPQTMASLAAAYQSFNPAATMGAGHHQMPGGPGQMPGGGAGAGQSGVQGGGHSFSVHQQTSLAGNMPNVSYSMPSGHTHPSPHMQQFVMMPHPQGGPGSQMNHNHLHHTQHQFQPHAMPGGGPMQPQMMSQSSLQGLPTQNPAQGPHPTHQMQPYIPQGLAAAALTSALHNRPEHFIVQHLRK